MDTSFLQSDIGKQILDNSPDKIFVVGEGYQLQFFNQSAQKFAFLFGLKNIKIGDIVLPSIEVDFWKKTMDRGLKGEAFTFKNTYVSGKEKHTDLVSVFPIQIPNNSTPACVIQGKTFETASIAEKDLLESESLFKSLFDTSPLGITIRDLESQELITFNNKICEMFDCTPEEFRNYQRSNFIHHEDINAIKENTSLLINGTIQNFKLEKQYKDSNGKVFWGEATRSVFQYGGIKYQIGILENISTQKKFENQLIQKEAKLKAIFNSTRDKIFAIDKNYRLIDANHSASQTLTYLNFDKDRQKNIDLKNYDFATNDYWSEHLSRAFNGEEFNFESGFYEIRGEMHFDLVTVSPLKNAKDEIIGASIYGKEITELKNIQQALAESESRLLDAERLAKLGYWEIDVKTKMISWSKGAPKIYGFPPEKLTISLKDYYDLIHPDDRDLLINTLQNSIEQALPYDLKTRKINLDGECIYTIGRGEPYLENGKVVKIFGTIQDVTNESKIENALIKNEAKVRAIFNSTEDKIFAIDTQYQLLDFNESAAKVLPQIFEVKEFKIGINILPKTPSLRKQWLDHFDQALQGNRIYLEKKYTQNGEEKIDIVILSPIQNEHNQIIGTALYGKDITDLQRAEKAYQDTQVKLRDAQKLGKIGNWKYDGHTQNITWSDSILKMFEYDVTNPPNVEECLQLVHPEEMTGLMEALYASIKKGVPFERISKMYTRTGKMIYTQAKGISTLNSDNKIIAFEGTIQDITQLKKIEENIEFTNQKYRELFENIYDGIVVVNEEGKMIEANPAAEALLGYPKADLETMMIKDIVHPDDQERSLIFLQKLKDQGYYNNYQGRIISKDGTTRYVQVNSNAIFKEGKMVGSRDIVRDISELREAEEKREQALIELAEVNKELKDFAYIVSHDLKAPLRAINAISNWLAEDYADVLDQKGLKQLQLLNNRVNRMHQFINGIFEYTKLSRIKESKEIVDLNEVIRNASLMLNIKDNVQLNLLKPLPEVFCEKIKIEQVFLNLISNAIKYNDKEICKIEVDYEDQETHFLFKIKDNGTGIDKKNHEKIFKIFQTLQPKDDFESTGIGLSIVKRIVELHDGKININSVMGQSTTFEFTLKK